MAQGHRPKDDRDNASPLRGPRFDETSPAYRAGRAYADNQQFGRGLFLGLTFGAIIGMIAGWCLWGW